MNKEKCINNLSDFEMSLNNVNVIAFIITEWHLTGVKAFIEYLENNKEIDVNANVYLMKHPSAENFVNIEESDRFNLYYLNNKLKYPIFRGDVIEDNKEIYILSAAFANIQCAAYLKKKYRYNVKTVVLDDGLGTYYGFLHWIELRYKETKSLGAVIKFILGRVYNFYFIRKNKIENTNFYLFQKHNNDLLLNEPVADIYRANFVTDKQISNKGIDNSVIIVTQQFSDNDSMQSLFDLYCKIGKKIIDNGINVFVKMHPREKDENKYIEQGFEILKSENGEGIEEMLCSSSDKPLAVIGFYSTAMVTIKAFCDIESISLAQIILDNPNIKVSRANTISFIEKFGKFITIPKSDIEIERIIMDVKGRDAL